MDASLQIHNFPSRLAKQDTVTEFAEINQLREFKIRASLPCRLSCRIFSKATLCGSPVKAAVVGVCQVKAVDWVFRSVPRASPSVLCHYWDVRRKKIEEKSSSKYNFLLFSTSLAAAVLQQVRPANTARVCRWWRVMIGQSVVRCLSVVRICVWHVVI